MAGTISKVTRVASDNPKKTTVPTAIRLSYPAPMETISGTAPMMAVSEVIRMGRSRRTEPAMMASSKDSPRWRSWLMNSTMRMPFLVTMPISMIIPIWL
ncbi:hypothetical protein D3C72_1245750 [compost metagenome]